MIVLTLNEKRKVELRKAVEKRTVTLPDGTTLPSLGQGTWYMGEDPRMKEKEIRALQLGLDLGMRVIDTAEMYGDGGSERVVGEAIKGRREEVFLVSKVYPHNADLDRIEEKCEQSLKRLGTDYVDLYLLHWRGSVPLEETIEGMEKLREAGKIKRWGVSNFDTADMEELWTKPNGENCVVNQVMYHLGSRGIEYDLVPWFKERNMPIMAYSPLAHGAALRSQIKTEPAVLEVAEKHDVGPLQIALAWTIRENNCLSIPKAVQEKHVIQNAEAATIEFDEEDLTKLSEAFPAPNRKVPLDIL